MKKNLGVIQAVFPMPVLIVAAYDANGTVQAMNAAWGQICNSDRIALFIDEEHATTQALLKSKAFTVALADQAHMDVADYLGIATGNKMPDKFARSGYHAVKSEHVNAPIIDEFPVVMECELAEVVENESFYCIVGKIVNTAAEERVLDEKGMAHTGTYDITPEDRNLYFTLGDTRIALLSYAASANYGANKKYDFSTVYEHANFLRPYDSPLMRAPESPCVKETFAFVEGLLERKLGFEEKAMLRKAMHQPVAFGDDVFDRAETDPFFEALRRDYEKARKNADVVIICPHSGGQFNTEPGEVSKYFFGQMAKIGFDAVVAAHSHTTQRVEKQGGTIIANCLGNVSMSPLTGYMSSVKETLSTYGMALHFYVAGGRIKRAAFSLFNAVQTGTQPMRVIPVCDYLSILPDEEKTAASAEIAQIYKRITGREMNSVEKEWALF